MIFVIMAGKMADTDTLYYTSSPIAVALESIVPSNAGTYVANGQLRDASCTFIAVYNGTTLLTAGNWSEVSECKLKNLTALYSAYKINYTYTYSQDSTGAVAVINDTGSSIASVTDWFDIFIVIGAMVVLILLTVIIITAIRSSGMVDGGNTNPANLGSA